MQAPIVRTRQRRWRRWRRVLLLGVVLGLIEGLLLLGSTWLGQGPSDVVLFVLLSLFFYLFLPAVEGVLAARQGGDLTEASGLGCLVGGIGFLVLVLAGACALLIMPSTNDALIIQVVITFFLLLEGLAGAICGLLGGWIGGVLGRQRAGRSSPRGGALSSSDPSHKAR